MIVLYTTDNYYTIILSSGSSRLTFSSVIRRTKVNIKYNVQLIIHKSQNSSTSILWSCSDF